MDFNLSLQLSIFHKVSWVVTELFHNLRLMEMSSSSAENQFL